MGSLFFTACVPVQGTSTPEGRTPVEMTTTSAYSPTPDTEATIEPGVEGMLAAMPSPTPKPTESTPATQLPATTPLEPRATPTVPPIPTTTVTPTPTIAPVPTPTQVPTATPQPTPTFTPFLAPTPTIRPPSSGSGGATQVPYSPSTIPHIFAGTATINGLNAPAGTLVAFWIEGNLAGVTQVKSGGAYSMALGQVSGQPSFSGKTIVFTIDSLTAQEQITWQSGGATPLNLTADQ